MIGVFYNGILLNVVVIIGVEGLKIIILIVVISSWYDYYCVNGVVIVLGGY